VPPKDERLPDPVHPEEPIAGTHPPPPASDDVNLPSDRKRNG
jgi:hypothetical protein